jgi:hypothetical protein
LKAEIVALKANTGASNRNNEVAAKQKAEKNAWKKIPPSEGGPKLTKFEDRMYYWRGNHKIWTMRKEECKGCDYQPGCNHNHNGNTEGNNSNGTSPQVMTSTAVTNNVAQHIPNVRVN